MFVVFDERVHSLHVRFLLENGATAVRCQRPSESSTCWHVHCKNIHTLAPNSTRLARFWTDLATSVRVLPAVEDGGSAKRHGSLKHAMPVVG